VAVSHTFGANHQWPTVCAFLFWVGLLFVFVPQGRMTLSLKQLLFRSHRSICAGTIKRDGLPYK